MNFTLVRIVLVAACCAVGCRYFVHMLQLESYQLPGYRRWLNRNRDKLLKRCVLVGIGGVILSWYMTMFLSLFITQEAHRESVANWVVLVLFILATLALAIADWRTPAKKPLIYTRRVRRLYIALAVICLAGSALLSLIHIPPYLLYAANAYLVYVAALIMQPVEKRINFQFFDRAKKNSMRSRI